MEGEEEVGEHAAIDISVHSLAVAACGDMAEEKNTEIRRIMSNKSLRSKCCDSPKITI